MSDEKKHSGSKYLKVIEKDGARVQVDVYDLIVAFEISCPARQHAIKKLLFAGQRSKGSVEQDLTECRDAITRAIELAK